MRGIIAIALLGILAAASTARSQTAPAAAGTVRQLQGSGKITGAGPAHPLALNGAVFSEDVIETGAGSKALVGFIDGTALTLGPNAEVVVDAYVYNPNGSAANAALKVTAGAMRLVAGAVERIGGAKAITVATPVGSIGIRGTDFFVEMAGDHLSVALFSGQEIAVSNDAGVTTLRPGEGTDVWAGSAPTQALTWAPDRVNRALALVTVANANEKPLPYGRPLASADDLGAALFGGKFKLDGRLRYEFVDHASQPRTAYAGTARLRLGYETLAWNGLFAGAEGEAAHALADRRSDGVRVDPNFPVIADPDSEILNQAYLGWTTPGADGLVAARAALGRQRIAYENERWVGPSAFRQSDQTFDAATLEARLSPRLNLRYAYVERVNRVLGNNPGGHWHSDSHMFGAVTNIVPFGTTTAYAYLLDLRPVPLLSSATYGVRYEGTLQNGPWSFGLETEAARQTDYAANPRNFALTYALVTPSLKWRGSMLAAGWEQLGGNGVAAVQTPLATLHRHNGWADVFTATPPNGLRDLHLRFVQDLPNLEFFKMPKLDVRFHDFAPTHGGGRYGTEWDADLNASILGRVTAGVRFAAYNARGFDADTKKVWVYLEFQY